jgi:hypothetical protein
MRRGQATRARSATHSQEVETKLKRASMRNSQAPKPGVASLSVAHSGASAIIIALCGAVYRSAKDSLPTPPRSCGEALEDRASGRIARVVRAEIAGVSKTIGRGVLAYCAFADPRQADLSVPRLQCRDRSLKPKLGLCVDG